MSGTGQQRRPNERLFDGRIEKRLTMSVPVYLASLKEPRAREITVTKNVSPHGACVVSKRSWLSGEEATIAPRGEFAQVGRVVYCGAKTGGAFVLGLEFPDHSVKWGDYPRT